MSELQTILDTIDNQAAGREQGCLSMRSERILANEYRRLRDALELISGLTGQPAAQDIAGMTLVEPIRPRDLLKLHDQTVRMLR